MKKIRCFFVVGFLIFSSGAFALNHTEFLDVVDKLDEEMPEKSEVFFCSSEGMGYLPFSTDKESLMSQLPLLSCEGEKIINEIEEIEEIEKDPFLPHTLVILPETNPLLSTTASVMRALADSGNSAFLFSATMLGVFAEEYKKEDANYDKAFESYHFFALPGALESGDNFILAVPNRVLGNDFGSKKKTLKVDEVTALEKQLGLRIEHLEDLGTLSKFKKSVSKVHLSILNIKDEVISLGLEKMVEELFVSKKSYAEKAEIPLWILAIDGEGARPDLCKKIARIERGYIVEQNRYFGGLPLSVVAKTIKKLLNDIDIMVVNIFSCWGGVVYLAQLANKLEEAKLSNGPVLTVMSFTGYSNVHAVIKKDGYDTFLRILCKIRQSWRTWSEEARKKSFMKAFEEAAPYLTVHKRKKMNGGELPGVKFPGKDNKIIPVSSFDSTEIILHCNEKSLSDYFNKQKINILRNPAVLLCTGLKIKDISVEWDGAEKNLFYPYLTSGLPDRFYQKIETLKIPSNVEKCSTVLKKLFPSHCSRILKKRFNKMCKKSKEVAGLSGAEWAVRIKNIVKMSEKDKKPSNTKGDKWSIYARFLKEATDALFVVKEKGTKSYFSYRFGCLGQDWYYDFGGVKEKNAKEWKQVFKKNMKLWAKAGNCMGKYLSDSVKGGDVKKQGVGDVNASDDLSSDDLSFNDLSFDDLSFDLPKL